MKFLRNLLFAGVATAVALATLISMGSLWKTTIDLMTALMAQVTAWQRAEAIYGTLGLAIALLFYLAIFGRGWRQKNTSDADED